MPRRRTVLAAPLLLLLGAGTFACSRGHDADGDGFSAAQDCDDADASAFPGADELCDDGVDGDCDDDDAQCRRTGTTTPGDAAVGSGAGARFGSSLAAIGDLDGDGFGDVLVGAPGDGRGGAGAGAAVLRFGSAAGLDATRSLSLLGGPNAQAGRAVAGGMDVTGDGVADLLVGAPGAGAQDAALVDGGTGLAAGEVVVVAGPFVVVGHEERPLSGPTIRGDAATDCIGRALTVGDLDGDGVGDVFASASCRGSFLFVHPHGDLDMLQDGPGAAGLFPGPVSADLGFADARLTVRGNEDWDRLGAALAVGPDHDGDEVRDLFVGAPDYYGADWINLPAQARVLLVSGAASGSVTDGDALATLFGGCCGNGRHEALGTALAVGDVDDDGRADLLAGAPSLLDFGVAGGAIALPGALAGSVDALAQGAWLAGPEQDAALPGRAGAAVLAGADFDGDGVPDVAVGVPDDATTGARGGAVRVLYGAVTGFVTLGSSVDRSLHVVSGLDNEQLGAALVAADLDGDGIDDLVIGAPEARAAGLSAGAVRVVLGRGI